MVDKSYAVGRYNVTEIQFQTDDASRAQSKEFLQAYAIIPEMLQHTLPDYPNYPPVTLVVNVDQVGEHTRESVNYEYDENGKRRDTKDVTKVTSYNLDTHLWLLTPDGKRSIATALVSHSVETDRTVETSSLRENLVHALLSGPAKTVALPEFYLAYVQKVLRRLYPERKCTSC